LLKIHEIWSSKLLECDDKRCEGVQGTTSFPDSELIKDFKEYYQSICGLISNPIKKKADGTEYLSFCSGLTIPKAKKRCHICQFWFDKLSQIEKAKKRPSIKRVCTTLAMLLQVTRTKWRRISWNKNSVN